MKFIIKYHKVIKQINYIKFFIDKTLEESLETIVIQLKGIKGEILEIVMDYLNHKVNYIFIIYIFIIQYYYEKVKKELINDVINEDYQIPADKALDVLKATILLEC